MKNNHHFELVFLGIRSCVLMKSSHYHHYQSIEALLPSTENVLYY